MQLRVIIVDDEIDAGKNLQKTLLDCVDSGIIVLGILNSTLDAEKYIIEQEPDVVFLDIEMPHENAFEFLDRISPINFEVIFVTAYDEYAVRAFKLNAVDYILKPISDDEVARALEKAQKRIGYKKLAEEQGLYKDLSNNLKKHTKLDKIRLKDSTGTHIVDFKDVLYIEANGSYTSVFFSQDSKLVKNILTSNSLNEYEELLQHDIFFRIHRSYLVNCMHVKKVLTDDNSLIMKNKAKLPVSRRRISELMEHFRKQ